MRALSALSAIAVLCCAVARVRGDVPVQFRGEFSGYMLSRTVFHETYEHLACVAPAAEAIVMPIEATITATSLRVRTPPAAEYSPQFTFVDEFGDPAAPGFLPSRDDQVRSSVPDNACKCADMRHRNATTGRADGRGSGGERVSLVDRRGLRLVRALLRV